MRIVFAGGGTGGHFYPLIAVAEEINNLAQQRKILNLELFYLSNEPYDKQALYEQKIKYVYVPAGKLKGFSPETIIGLLKEIIGCFVALQKMFSIFPDVVFAKGCYASFPILFAAWILRIPTIIHESDSIPGKVNRWAGKFAKKIAVSFEEAGRYFPQKKTAWIGQPVRSFLRKTEKSGVFEYLGLNPTIPTILILGGSQGAQKINDVILQALPELIQKYQIIHQVGKKNLNEIETLTSVILQNNPFASRYKFFDFLSPLALKMAAGAASLVVSRAGSTIFEIAAWGLPSIIIPLSSSANDHQKHNAYNYARSGACIVIEESNFTPHLLIYTINSLINDENEIKKMKEAAVSFYKSDAALKIAEEIIRISLQHE